MAFTTAKIISGRMMSPDTGVVPGSRGAEDSGGGETVRMGDVDCAESAEASSLSNAVCSVIVKGFISATGESVIGETTTAGVGDVARSASSSSSSAWTVLPNELASGVLSSRISSSAFSRRGGSLDRPSEGRVRIIMTHTGYVTYQRGSCGPIPAWRPCPQETYRRNRAA